MKLPPNGWHIISPSFENCEIKKKVKVKFNWKKNWEEFWLVQIISWFVNLIEKKNL